MCSILKDKKDFGSGAVKLIPYRLAEQKLI
jgi:hypothetical protein